MQKCHRLHVIGPTSRPRNSIRKAFGAYFTAYGEYMTGLSTSSVTAIWGVSNEHPLQKPPTKLT